jgi:hypothetical protein
MAGEIQLNSTTFATESGGTVTVSNVDSATNRQNLGLEIGVDVQSYDADTTKNDVANTFTANQIISVTDNTNAALRVTQLGTGNALVVEDSTNPDSTPFVVNASGNVGIGTSSPGVELEVEGDIRADGIYGQADTNTSIQFPGSDVITFNEGGSEAMRIDSNGNVGIGVVPESGWRSISNAVQIGQSGVLQGQTSASVLEVGSNYYVNSSDQNIYINSDFATREYQYQGNFVFETAPSGTAGASFTWSERMRIDSSGTVLVNTPSTLLAGAGSIQVQSIGTGGAIISKSSEWSTYTQYIWNSTTANDSRFISFGTEGSYTESGSIDFNRGATLTRYNTTSDAKLKNIIGDSDGKESIQILKTTRIRNYAWKEDVTQKTQVGVIAQELRETYKGAVSVGGEDAQGNYRPWMVDKTAFTFHLIAGWQAHEKIIQEQQTLIESQQSQIDELTARIVALETT